MRVSIIIRAAIVQHLPLGICTVMWGLSRFSYQNTVLCSPRVAPFILRTPGKQRDARDLSRALSPTAWV